MNKLKKMILMLCLILSGVLCYAIGAAGMENVIGKGIPIEVKLKVIHGGLDKSSSITTTMNGHLLFVAFDENLGRVSVDVKSNDNVLSTTKISVDSYLQEEFKNDIEKIRIAMEESDYIFEEYDRLYSDVNTPSGNLWFKENQDDLTTKQKELLSYLNDVLNNPQVTLDNAMKAFEYVQQRVNKECTEDEKIVMNYAISIGIASCNYWYYNAEEWCRLFDVNSKGWFSWGNLCRDDISGAIGGAIGGAAVAFFFGGVGILAGAGAGALSAGLAGSAICAINQVWDHYVN